MHVGSVAETIGQEQDVGVTSRLRTSGARNFASYDDGDDLTVMVMIMHDAEKQGGNEVMLRGSVKHHIPRIATTISRRGAWAAMARGVYQGERNKNCAHLNSINTVFVRHVTSTKDRSDPTYIARSSQDAVVVASA